MNHFINHKWLYRVFLVLFGGIFATAQIQEGNARVDKNAPDIAEESVVVERIFEPKVEAAEKIKQTPNIQPPGREKLPVKYGLKDVAVASDFETTTLGADTLSPQQDELYKNYIRAGYGNRSTLLIDGFATHEWQPGKEVGATLKYNSTQGDIKGIDYDTGETRLGAQTFLNIDQGNQLWNAYLGYDYSRFNYYGIPNPDFFGIQSNQDIKQVYNQISAGGSLELLEHNYLEKVSVNSYFLSDRFGSQEMLLSAVGDFGKENLTEIRLGDDFTVGANTQVSLDYSNTQFSEINDLTFNYLMLGARPQATLEADKLGFTLGANVIYNTESNASQSDFYVFPMAEVRYRGWDAFGVYAGVTGGVENNRFGDMYLQNPYLLPLQTLLPTENNLEVYAGIRGDVLDHFKYNAKATYQSLDNVLLFVKSDYFDGTGAVPYGLLNAFQGIYDNATVLRVEGSVSYVAIEDLNLMAKVGFQNYSMDNEDEAWGIPALSGEINASYKLLDDKLILGADIFAVGERQGLRYFTPFLSQQQSLDPFVDINLNASYMITPRWSAFVEGRNLLNNNYDRFIDYPVQGIQATGGIMFKF